jgi:hypothetical protein
LVAWDVDEPERQGFFVCHGNESNIREALYRKLFVYNRE